MRKLTSNSIANALAFVFALYPIMVIKYIPFGGGARYLTVLSSLAAVAIIFVLRKDFCFSRLFSDLKNFCKPFVPLILSLAFLAFYHSETMDLHEISMSVLCGALIYAALNRANFSESNFAICAAWSGWLYLAVSMYEVFYLGHARAFGGGYSNRLAEFCVLGLGFCLIYLLRNGSVIKANLNIFMFLSIFAMFIALVLSGSRGPFLALPALVLIFIWKHFHSKFFWFFTLVLIVFFLFLIIIFDAQYADRVRLAFSEVKLYFESGHMENSSIGLRLEFWRIAFETATFDNFFGNGKMPFVVLAQHFPDVRDGALYMNYYFSNAGVHNPWVGDGEIPQIVMYGGLFLLVVYLLTFILLLCAGRLNAYKFWILSCVLFFGLGEIVIFNRVGCAMFVSCWAIVSSCTTGLQEKSMNGNGAI